MIYLKIVELALNNNHSLTHFIFALRLDFYLFCYHGYVSEKLSDMKFRLFSLCLKNKPCI